MIMASDTTRVVVTFPFSDYDPLTRQKPDGGKDYEVGKEYDLSPEFAKIKIQDGHAVLAENSRADEAEDE